MGKAPAFQFYVRDWLSDPALQVASSSTRGIWINALCYMWEAKERGSLIGTQESLARLLGATDSEMALFLEEAEALRFADVTLCNKKVTVVNRRMYREEKERENTRLRVGRHREKRQSNKKVTVPSSSSSSSSCTKVHLETPSESCSEPQVARELEAQLVPPVIEIPLIPRDGKHPVTQLEIEEWSLVFPGIDVLTELRKIVLWCNSNPQRRKTRRGATRFITTWLSGAQDRSSRSGNARMGEIGGQRPELVDPKFNFVDLSKPSPSPPNVDYSNAVPPPREID